MNIKRRTFFDHLNYLNPPTRLGYDFREYGNLFLKWTQFQGYIPTHFSNSIYIFYNNMLTDSNLNNGNPDYERKIEILSDRERGLLETIQEVGYNTEVYQLYCELVKEHDFEEKFCLSFVEAISLHAAFKKQKSAFIKATKKEINSFFEVFLKKNIFGDKREDMDCFLEDLEFFINNIPKAKDEEFGYFLTKNINHYWEDVGLIIYSKTHFTRTILFYQIGDNN